MRASLLLLVSILLASALPVRADVTYDLTLTAHNAPVVGSGTLTLNTLPPANSEEDFVTEDYADRYPGTQFPYRLKNLVVNFDGDTFQCFGSPANAADADFDRGALVTLNAAVVSGNSSIDFGNGGAGGLGYLGGFTFFGNFPSYDIDYGVVTATLAPASTTPEPSAFVLLGTGLLGAVAVGKNRLRS